MSLANLVVEGEQALQVAVALGATSFRILQLLSSERLSITSIAETESE